MEKRNIQECAVEIISRYRELNYCQSTIDGYKRDLYNGIGHYMTERGLTDYSPSVSEDFLSWLRASGSSESKIINHSRMANALAEFYITGNVYIGHLRKRKYEWHGSIGGLIQDFIAYNTSLRKSHKTINMYRLILYRLWDYFNSKGISDIESVTQNDIIEFASTSINKIQQYVGMLRVWLRYLFENNFTSQNLSIALEDITYNKRKPLPSVYSKEEVAVIESSIDRKSILGKRNYAMLLLTSRLGLRASDVASLHFRNVDWERNAITLIQYKTGKEIELPLLTDVGEAIIDYLRYSRKKSPSSSIFLNHFAPFTPVTPVTVSYAVRCAINKSGLDIDGRKLGSHTMRHSLASRLLERETPLPLISQTLGHSNYDSTMFYLRIDVNSLRKCALDVNLVNEEFYLQEGGMFYA